MKVGGNKDKDKYLISHHHINLRQIQHIIAEKYEEMQRKRARKEASVALRKGRKSRRFMMAQTIMMVEGSSEQLPNFQPTAKIVSMRE